MKKTVLFVISLFIFPIAASAQGKTTADPNSVQAAVKEQADQRLSQKITYSSGYKRLHEVTEDLTQISGVYIGCGQNKKDWHVRDIPLVVCVKDMPLGKLLRAIADATHTWFASEKVGDDSSENYLIYRRHQEEQKIDDYFDKMHQALLEGVKWQWDALAAYGRMNEDAVPTSKYLDADQRRRIWLKARLISSLDPESDERMLTGENFKFKANDPNYQSIVAELHEPIRRIQQNEPPNKKFFPLDEMDMITFNIKLVDSGSGGETHLVTSLGPIVSGNSWTHYCEVCTDANQLNGKLSGLPDYPKQVHVPTLEEDMNNPEMVLLNRYPDQSWDHPILKDKIDLIKPESIRDATFADLIKAVVSASGMNIVTEDFTSHSSFDYQNINRLFAKNTTVADTLTNINPEKHIVHTDYAWFLDEKDNLLVGWADDRRFMRWREHHRHMIAGEYIDYLKNKLAGSGLEIDDIVPLASISKESYGEWIRDSKDLAQISMYLDRSIWMFYNSLDSSDKNLAKSNDGLPLLKFDPQLLANALSHQKLEQSVDSDMPFTDQHLTDAQAKSASQETDFRNLALHDPNVIATMVLRLLKSPAKYRWVPTKGNIAPPSSLQLSHYDIEIRYVMNGETHIYTASGPNSAFPIYSPAREAEILKSAK